MTSLSVSDSLFNFISHDIRPWVKDNIKMSEIATLGDSLHPIDILYELLVDFYPLQKITSFRRDTEQNRVRSKLKKIREFFIENKLECPKHWAILYEKSQDDQEFLKCINFVLIVFQNHVFKDELTYFTNQQIKLLKEMLDIQESNRFYRKKLQTILDYVQRNRNCRYCPEIENFITTEPDIFKVE
ncbi:hypothetical protein M9Y10_023565 [Tritrichomonas musculus]|uniref:Uncharacterized protein n=1 Tax=Tritrichomonas musculus TaxID=1915356 RepID=A0ABR2KVQ2_9EUKA